MSLPKTKEDLKTALSTRGVEFPIAKSFNNEDNESNVTRDRYSSDEEEEEDKGSKRAEPVKKSAVAKVLTEDNAMIVDDLNIAELSDEGLFEKLKEHGVDVGPIVDSTRQIYRKKLAILLRGGESPRDESDAAYNGSHVQTNGGEFSADEDVLELQLDAEEDEAEEEEEEERQPAPVVKKISRLSTGSRSSKTASTNAGNTSFTNLRQRIKGAFDRSPDKNKNDRFTPTPRRSIHSYKISETTKESITKTRDGNILRDFEYKKETSGGNREIGGDSWTNKLSRILPRIFYFLLFAVIGFYVYKNYIQGQDLSQNFEQALKWAKNSPKTHQQGEGKTSAGSEEKVFI